MRFFLFLLGVWIAAVAVGTRAEAQNYPWCAVLNTGDASYNCGFTSFEQCMETVRGIGGFCNQNTQYQPPPGPHVHRLGRYPN
jgi:hypothetical protein